MDVSSINGLLRRVGACALLEGMAGDCTGTDLTCGLLPEGVCSGTASREDTSDRFALDVCALSVLLPGID